MDWDLLRTLVAIACAVTVMMGAIFAGIALAGYLYDRYLHWRDPLGPNVTYTTASHATINTKFDQAEWDRLIKQMEDTFDQNAQAWGSLSKQWANSAYTAGNGYTAGPGNLFINGQPVGNVRNLNIRYTQPPPAFSASSRNPASPIGYSFHAGGFPRTNQARDREDHQRALERVLNAMAPGDMRNFLSICQAVADELGIASDAFIVDEMLKELELADEIEHNGHGVYKRL